MPRRRYQAIPWDQKSPEQRRKSSAGAICGFCVYRTETGLPDEAAHYKYACRSPETAPHGLWSPSYKEVRSAPCVDVVNEQGGCDLFVPLTD